MTQIHRCRARPGLGHNQWIFQKINKPACSTPALALAEGSGRFSILFTFRVKPGQQSEAWTSSSRSPGGSPSPVLPVWRSLHILLQRTRSVLLVTLRLEERQEVELFPMFTGPGSSGETDGHRRESETKKQQKLCSSRLNSWDCYWILQYYVLYYYLLVM